MLKQRVISAIIGLPIVLGLFSYGPEWLVMILFTVCVGVSAYETNAMLTPRFDEMFTRLHLGSDHSEDEKPFNVGRKTFFFTTVALSCILFLGAAIDTAISGRSYIVFCILGSMLFAIFLAPRIETAVGRLCAMIISICYGALPWLAIWDLYTFGSRASYLFLLLAVVWAGDTGAYFGGKAFGKTPLAPAISPKKTREGAFFGILASAAGGLAAQFFYEGKLAGWHVIIIASILGGILGQLGDLVESTLKRFGGVKDSGAIIPGHGGFLDRVDGLLFAAPIIWLILYISR